MRGFFLIVIYEVMVGAESGEENFRKIDLGFLDKDGDESFDIFYKTETFGTVKYVKFASTDPKHQDKVRRLLEDGTDQDFYIHEDNLFKYYKYATRSLKAMDF
ncbi:MAG TPA: hypothetical protein HPP54_02250 [Nitrospinae bacterium]|nr:hypothetical protein [Nitrospinota bacterium]